VRRAEHLVAADVLPAQKDNRCPGIDQEQARPGERLANVGRTVRDGGRAGRRAHVDVLDLLEAFRPQRISRQQQRRLAEGGAAGNPDPCHLGAGRADGRSRLLANL
jgi:hypothetical protein